MHTVCETKAFRRDAVDAGMSLAQIDELVDLVAIDPLLGDVVQGTGGCRKLRFAASGKGKSGGYRVITFFTGQSLPIFLITVFGKGERSNLSKAECNSLATLTKVLAAEYRS